MMRDNILTILTRAFYPPQIQTWHLSRVQDPMFPILPQEDQQHTRGVSEDNFSLFPNLIQERRGQKCFSTSCSSSKKNSTALAIK